MIPTAEYYDIYLETRHNKRRSDDSIDYEIHLERNIMRHKRAVENHTQRPSAYTFVVEYPRPREVFACDFDSRMDHHHLARYTGPEMEKRMTSRSFNNRKGFGPLEAVNQLISDIYEVSNGFTEDCWIIGEDIQGYFPNISQDIAYYQQSELFRNYFGDDRDDLLYMLEASIFSYPTHHCVRKSPYCDWPDRIPPEKSLFTKPDGIGGAIGFLIWQMALNFYLNDFDKMMVEEYGFHYVRYVDDMRWVVKDKDAFLTMLPKFRKELADLHCTLHPRKFTCQHYTKGTTFIGYHIRLDRVHRDNRVLRSALRKVRCFNHHPREARLESFLSSVNSYIGQFKGCNDYNKIMAIVNAINPKWMQFVHFDHERLCFNANEEYAHRILLARRYGIKPKHIAKRPSKTSKIGKGKKS